MADVRPIDANALKEHIVDLPTWWADGGGVYPGSMKYPEGMFDPEDIVNSIDNAPTISPEDSRPHGHWMTHNNGMTECSECHTLGSPQWKCCPVCTAMMDGKENEDA